MRADLRPMEDQIARTKRELNELFREEALASRQGHAAEARQRHLLLLEKELENIRSIARYVEPISGPVARDLNRWHAQMLERFNALRDHESPEALQAWVVRDLVPHLRRSEQIAHLVATSVRANPRKASTPFGWPVREQRSAGGAAEPNHPGRSGAT